MYIKISGNLFSVTLQQSLPLKFLHHLAEFVVPLLAEAADEGRAEEDVQGHVHFLALDDGILADVPAVVVDAHKTSAELLHTDGIEIATDGLGRQEASTASAEGTIAAANDGGDHIAVGVGIRHSLLVYHCLGTGTELWPQGVQFVFYAGNLVHGDGSTGIALLATEAVALGDVATEALRNDVRVYYHIAHHEHRGQFVLLYHCMGLFPLLMRYLFASLKCPHPKKPRYADRGLGWAHWRMWWREASISCALRPAGAPQSRKTSPSLSRDRVLMTASVNVSHPLPEWLNAWCARTLRQVLSRNTP